MSDFLTSMAATAYSNPEGLTFAKILKAKEEIDKIVDSSRTVRLSEMRYHVVDTSMLPRVPVLQISKDFKYCSDEFRKEWNAWALERFGTVETAVILDTSLALGLRGGLLTVLDHKMMAAIKGIPCAPKQS